MNLARQFHRDAREKVADEPHREVMARNTATHGRAVRARIRSQFADWQAARRHCGAVKTHVLGRLPELLEEFEVQAQARGIQVHWAEDAAEAREIILDLARRYEVGRVVKSKSMTTEEIEINPVLEAAGIQVRETDLGEYIVQLAQIRPYHIVTPVMQLRRQEVAAIFAEKLGTSPTLSAEELTMVAREKLRDEFVRADLGISGANFLVAEDGAVVMIENEGNGRLSMSCPRVHIAVAGIEKILPRRGDLALFLPQLSTSGTGQQLPCYGSIVRGPRQADETDGPTAMHVVLLDNGRSHLYAQDALTRSTLTCIRCGSCINACPVYRLIGGHAYNTVYMGPIGAAITPHLRGLREWAHLCDASSLCGACTFDCPVGIELHHVLLTNRVKAARGRGGFWRWAMRGWAWGMHSRGRAEFARRWLRLAEPGMRLLPEVLRRRLPKLAPRTFASRWRKR